MELRSDAVLHRSDLGSNGQNGHAQREKDNEEHL